MPAVKSIAIRKLTKIMGYTSYRARKTHTWAKLKWPIQVCTTCGLVRARFETDAYPAYYFFEAGALEYVKAIVKAGCTWQMVHKRFKAHGIDRIKTQGTPPCE